MSATGTRMNLATAEAYAADVLDAITGEAHVVGSVRRKSKTVGDIELLVHWDADIDLPMSVGPLLPSEYDSIKGGPDKKDGWKYWQLHNNKHGFNLDLFRFDNNNRGSLMLIRTGPAEFSRRFVMALNDHGLKHEGGYVRWIADDEIVACDDERRAFELAGMRPYIEPAKRR